MNVLPLAVNAHKRSILWENNIVDTYIYIAALKYVSLIRLANKTVIFLRVFFSKTFVIHFHLI